MYSTMTCEEHSFFAVRAQIIQSLAASHRAPQQIHGKLSWQCLCSKEYEYFQLLQVHDQGTLC